MASIMCLQVSMQEEDILEHTDHAKCHLCTLESTCSNIAIHLMTLLNILMPRY
jgi:hypothetical protein